MKTAKTPFYTETLRLNSKVIYGILGICTLLAVGARFYRNGSEWDAQEWESTLVPAVIITLLWWLVLGSRIKLRLDAQGVSYQFWPFWKRTARWEELQGWYVREVNAFGEFGGWGIRYGFGRGWGYVNTSPWGLQLVRKNDKRVTISTRRPEELRAWLEQWAPAEVVGS